MSILATAYGEAMKRSLTNSSRPLLKHFPTLAAFTASGLVAFLFRDVVVTHPPALLWAALVMVGATLLASYYSVGTRATPWSLLVPGISLLSIALLRYGTGGTTSLFGALIILPALWISAQAGRRWVIVAIFGTSAALMLPSVIDRRWSADASEWLRGIVVPVIFGLAAIFVNELSRQARQQVDDVQRLVGEGENLLAESLSTAAQLEANEVQLRAADRLTRSVLDAVTEQSVIGTDLTGLIDVWNPGAQVMLGLSPFQAQGKRYVFEFHLVDELDAWSRELNYPHGATVLNPGFSALVESARLGRAEVRDWTYVRDDGSRISVSIAVTPRLDDRSETVGYIFVATDVTHALESSRLKDEFVGLISHELRTPLSSILGYLELIRDDDEAPLSAEQLQYLGVAERNAHRLLALVGDLLFTAQVSSGRFPLTLTTVKMSEVVSAAVLSAGPVALGAGVELLIELPADALSVRGDSVRLGQACDNLISNALKFTPRGGRVTVSLGSRDDFAVVTVRDTGIGIPESELDQLYARFFRASTATRNAVPGVGLGLTITKAIVAAHEGELDVESEEGVGTAFIMTLPVATLPLATQPLTTLSLEAYRANPAS